MGQTLDVLASELLLAHPFPATIAAMVRVWGSVFLFCMTTAFVARADDQSIGLQQFEQGRVAFEKGDHKAALESFSASMQALPSPNTRLYIARCHRALGHTASAYTNFKLASREAADRLSATGEKRYTATRDSAAAEATELEPKVPHLTIAVPSDMPEGAKVTLDGKDLASSSWGVALDADPGAHVVAAQGARRVPFNAPITLAEGQSLRVSVAMARIPTATLSVTFREKPSGMSVELDGKPLDPSQWDAPRELDVGEHRVAVHAPGFNDFVWRKSLADGASDKVEVRLEPGASAGSAGGSRGTPKWLFFGVAGVSVIALGIGAYLAIDATSRASSEKDKDSLARSPGEQSDIRSEATAANVLFVGGAAIAAGAGVLAFTTNWKSSSRPPTKFTTGTRITPYVTPWGVGASGRF
jgi:hypothetical protein